MAGRGRGRGGARSAMSFNVEDLGFRRGDPLPGAQALPPPLYPQLLSKPPPFNNTEELEYLQALKEDYRTTMSKSPHFIKADAVKNSIARYSDKFRETKAPEEDDQLWEMDVRFLPPELHPAQKRKRGHKNGEKSRKWKPKISPSSRLPDVSKRLEELEKKETEEGPEHEDQRAGEEPEKKKPKVEGEETDEESEEEENLAEGESDADPEEPDDYGKNYFRWLPPGPYGKGYPRTP